MIPTPTPSPSLWLATGSPRRRALLEQAGYTIAGRLRPATSVDESLRPQEPAEAAALRLARSKLAATLSRPDDLPPGVVLLAADTLVIAPDGRPMGKPVDDRDAERMLATLCGRWHQVVTAVVVGNGARHDEVLVASRLRFAQLDAAAIRAYVATGEPRDKAGAYGLQGLAGSFVEEMAGDCTAVVGLPLAATRRLLAGFGVRPAWMDRDTQGTENGNRDE